MYKISSEECNEGPRIVVVTCIGARTGADMMNGGKQSKQWVRNSVGPMPTFDPQQEKETYNMERKEILGQDWGSSTSSTTHVRYHDVPKKSNGKVSTLKKFFRSCIEIMKDETALKTLYEIIYHCTQERKTSITQRVVKHVLHRKRTNGEFRFNTQIGEYDVDNVILDLGSNVNVLPK
jgi:hypothetical protein